MSGWASCAYPLLFMPLPALYVYRHVIIIGALRDLELRLAYKYPLSSFHTNYHYFSLFTPLFRNLEGLDLCSKSLGRMLLGIERKLFLSLSLSLCMEKEKIWRNKPSVVSLQAYWSNAEHLLIHWRRCSTQDEILVDLTLQQPSRWLRYT